MGCLDPQTYPVIQQQNNNIISLFILISLINTMIYYKSWRFVVIDLYLINKKDNIISFQI